MRKLSARRSSDLGSDTSLKAAPPLLNLSAITDIAAITEEVIEGVSAGQNFDNTGVHDLTDVSAIAGGRGRTVARNGRTQGEILRKVETILDVETGDWIFTTQPGGKSYLPSM